MEPEGDASIGGKACLIPVLCPQHWPVRGLAILVSTLCISAFHNPQRPKPELKHVILSSFIVIDQSNQNYATRRDFPNMADGASYCKVGRSG